MKKFECEPCGYIYDPVVGDPDSGIAPGTAFEVFQTIGYVRLRTWKRCFLYQRKVRNNEIIQNKRNGGQTMTYDYDITFEDNLLTGNKMIDEQHKELIERIRNFVFACRTEKVR